MKRFVTFIVAAATLAIVACQDATGPGAGAPPLSQGPAQVAPNQYIVLFDRGLPDAAATGGWVNRCVNVSGGILALLG